MKTKEALTNFFVGENEIAYNSNFGKIGRDIELLDEGSISTDGSAGGVN
ncbi:MAG: hypothetical protein M1518_01295 [Candidatus Thermoplasmatota archaeon]|jgi:hypothetical protein|nr:hypothetical protein [Candidatus Thermoplasmatota archaeon]